MSATVIANSRRDRAGMLNQFFQTLIFMFSARNSFIKVINISLVVLAMMYLHGLRIYVGFQGLMCIR
jgi:hypothetical protein